MSKQQNVDYKAIGKRIKKLRGNRMWTQTQLGEKLSIPVSATAISLYESGMREVGIDLLTNIANLFNVPLEFLISGTESAPSINIALRADKDLAKNEKALGQIMDFINFVKRQEDAK